MVAIPKGFLDQYGVSAEMPRTQAVTRAAPPMRSPVLRDASKYQLKYVPYTDPQMVANVELAKGRIGQALTKGLIDLGNTFAAADASSQYTTAWTNFNLEAHGQLDFLKNQPLTRATSTVVGNQLVTDDDPTHVQLQGTLHKGLLQQRDRWAKTIKDPKARQQFLQNSISTVVSLQKQAAETARNKHILFLQGESIKHFEGALTVERIEQLVLQPHMQLIWTPKELLAFKDKYIKKLLFNDRDMEIRQAIDSKDSEKLWDYKQSLLSGKRLNYDTWEWEDDPHAKYLKKYKNETKQLFDLIKEGEKHIEAQIEKDDEARFAKDLSRIYQNPEQYTQEGINQAARADGWTQTQITAANNAWRQQFGGPLESDDDTRLDIADNIKDWDRTRIFSVSHKLTEAHLQNALRRRDEYENGIEDWKKQVVGLKAVNALKAIHGIDVSGGMTIRMPGMSGPTEAQKANKAYQWALLELEQQVEDLPPEERAAKAWEIVKPQRDEWIKANRPEEKPPGGGGDDDTTKADGTSAGVGANSSETNTEVKGIDPKHWLKAQRFAEENTMPDGTEITVDVARTLPADFPGREGIIEFYTSIGATFTKDEISGNRPTIDDAKAKGESVADWYARWKRNFDLHTNTTLPGATGGIRDHGVDQVVVPSSESVIPETHRLKKEKTTEEPETETQPTPVAVAVPNGDASLDMLFKDYVLTEKNFNVVDHDDAGVQAASAEIKNRLLDIASGRGEIYRADLFRSGDGEMEASDIGIVFYADGRFMDLEEYEIFLNMKGFLSGEFLGVRTLLNLSLERFQD